MNQTWPNNYDHILFGLMWNNLPLAVRTDHSKRTVAVQSRQRPRYSLGVNELTSHITHYILSARVERCERLLGMFTGLRLVPERI